MFEARTERRRLGYFGRIWKANPTGGPVDAGDMERWVLQIGGAVASLAGFIWYRKAWWPYITAGATGGMYYKWNYYDQAEHKTNREFIDSLTAGRPSLREQQEEYSKRNFGGL